MNVPTLTVPKAEARERLRAYRTELHRRADGRYQAAAEAYEALAEGTAVISLSRAFQEAGVESSTGLPRLAIARADRERVRCTWRWRERRPVFDSRAAWAVRRNLAFDNTTLRIPVDMGRGHRRSRVERRWNHRTDLMEDRRVFYTLGGQTPVPTIPPEVRAQVNLTDLPNRYILWEVERWEVPRQQRGLPPGDPLLLRRLGHGDLYAIEHEWDLTELERLVMEGAGRV